MVQMGNPVDRQTNNIGIPRVNTKGWRLGLMAGVGPPSARGLTASSLYGCSCSGDGPTVW